jgi:hypothetical protein
VLGFLGLLWLGCVAIWWRMARLAPAGASRAQAHDASVAKL